MAVTFVARQLEHLANRGDPDFLVEGPEDQHIVVVVAGPHDGQRQVGGLRGPEPHEGLVVAVPWLGLHAKAPAAQHADHVILSDEYLVGLLGLLGDVQVDGRLHRSFGQSRG